MIDDLKNVTYLKVTVYNDNYISNSSLYMTIAFNKITQLSLITKLLY